MLEIMIVIFTKSHAQAQGASFTSWHERLLYPRYETYLQETLLYFLRRFQLHAATDVNRGTSKQKEINQGRRSDFGCPMITFEIL